MSVTESFRLGVGPCVHPPLSVLGPCLTQTSVGPVCAAPCSEFKCVPGLLGLKDSALWSHPPALVLIIFPPCLPHGSLSLEGEEFDEGIPFRTECFSHSLCVVLLSLSVLISIFGQKHLWCGLIKVLTYGYSNMSSRLLPCPFSKIMAVGVP